MSGAAADDIWIGTSESLTHFDGTKWKRPKGFMKSAYVCAVAEDEVWETGIDPEEGKIHGIYRGNAKDGFVGLLPQEPNHKPNFGPLVHALGAHRCASRRLTNKRGSVDRSIGSETWWWMKNVSRT